MWGLFPLYWKPLAAVPALEVVAHRTAWGLASVAVWVTWRRRWGEVRAAVSSPRTLLMLTASASLIAVNWLTYIWAVINDHVVESSFGYYINPLVTVVLGVVVLGERLSRAQIVAVGLATAGVAILTVGHGRFPWIALVLAGTFGLYGLVRKLTPVSSLAGLSVETGMLAPLALGYLVVCDKAFMATALRYRWWALAIGTALAIVWLANRNWLDTDPDMSWRVFWAMYAAGLGNWLILVGILGCGKRYLDRTSPALSYLAEGSYPVYILHQTVIVVFAFYIVGWAVVEPLQWVALLAVSVAVTFALYEGVRRWSVTRFLFGMRPKRRPAAEVEKAADVAGGLAATRSAARRDSGAPTSALSPRR